MSPPRPVEIHFAAGGREYTFRGTLQRFEANMDSGNSATSVQLEVSDWNVTHDDPPATHFDFALRPSSA